MYIYTTLRRRGVLRRYFRRAGSRYSYSWVVPGAHEGRRPEGASNGGSKVQLSARYVQIWQTKKYYALADITLLRFDARIYTRCACATGTQEVENERYRSSNVELFCSTPRVPWRQQPAQPRIKQGHNVPSLENQEWGLKDLLMTCQLSPHVQYYTR